jgi:outer membrane receptor protein involved in Fe transport
MLHKIYNTLLFILGISGAALAQTAAPDGRISGTLLDEHSKPMMFATTSLLNAKDSSIVKGAISNEAGLYAFEHVKDGQYLIKVTTVGYDKTVSKPFSISPSSKSVAVPQITMQPNDHSLNTVNVVATKPLIEQKSDRLVLNVAGSVLAAGNSAMDILERAPGVSVDKDDNISLKGKHGVTVMLNDKLTYLTSAQLATLLRSTDGNTIQSIEIISNPPAKYDASGNSGIINIKLKKNKQTGTNGSITAGVGYGKYGKDNETFQLNHKDGKLNLFGTFSHSDSKGTQDMGIRRIVTDGADQTYFNQFTSRPQSTHNNSYRIGADYDVIDKNTFGVVLSGYFNSQFDANTNRTYIGPNFTQIDSSLNTISAIDQKYHNIAVNINDSWKLDTAGQQLNIDLDYSKFKNDVTAYYTTNFFLADESAQHPAAFLENVTPSTINIHTAKADYTLPITKSVKFETGVKLSDVKTDNDLQQSLVDGGQYASVNHFVYDEKIDAGYLNFSKDFKKTSVQLGLRGEYSSSNATGDSLNVRQVVARHYFNLFPSVFVNHTINEKNEIGVSYSRRIDRPQYDNLNPFVYHLDPYTYQKGNPYLKPQYTNNFEFNYTYNKSITLTLGYSRITDVITDVPGTDPATKVAFVTQQNLQVQNAYNANLYASYTITKWWEGNINATAFYLGFKSNDLEGANLDRGQTAYQLRANETFTPIKGYRFELTGNYQSALTYALFYVKPQYSVDAGVSHSFLNKKANLKFSVSDIFNIRRNDVTSNYQSVDVDIRQKRETRIARLTFTYNFGSTKIKMRQHESGADDLKNRVKGNN